jgi:hypothetical protein
MRRASKDVSQGHVPALHDDIQDGTQDGEDADQRHGHEHCRRQRVGTSRLAVVAVAAVSAFDVREHPGTKKLPQAVHFTFSGFSAPHSGHGSYLVTLALLPFFFLRVVVTSSSSSSSWRLRPTRMAVFLGCSRCSRLVRPVFGRALRWRRFSSAAASTSSSSTSGTGRMV